MSRLALVIGVVAVVSAVVAQAARADVGIVRVSRASASPGDLVRVWAGGAVRMPLYLVPRRAAPKSFSCVVEDGKPVAVPADTPGAQVCRQIAPRPPSGPPYVLLGRFTRPAEGERFPSLRFRVPAVRAGLYRFVIYCEGCYRGPGGSLIPSDFLFRVVGEGPRLTGGR